MSLESRCAIWGTSAERTTSEISQERLTIHNSPRADGSYTVKLIIADRVLPSLDDETKARLTTYLIRSREQGNIVPHIGPTEVDNALASTATAVHERALSLLSYIARMTRHVGQGVSLFTAIDGALAWSESIRPDEVSFLADYLGDRGLIETSMNAPTIHHCVLSVEGYSHLTTMRESLRPNQAFVAMWLDPSLDSPYHEAIKPAIEDAGYEACRIDQRESIGKIDDEIIREIRRSRFMIADFTQGEDGNRGSVYYEAGFARGLGLPVISTCREDQLSRLAFDTRQYVHIAWQDLVVLREQLANRIGAVIGEGARTISQDE